MAFIYLCRGHENVKWKSGPVNGQNLGDIIRDYIKI